MPDWPIGTPAERALALDRLPGNWTDSNPFMSRYQIGDSGVDALHTGADLNLNCPVWNADWHLPISAMGWGIVVFQGAGGGSWGHILVIWHWDYLTGQPYCCRFGHVDKPRVVTGQLIYPGQEVAQVGNGDGYYGSSGAHLHWDISPGEALLKKPNDWPGLDVARLQANYTAPIPFVIKRKTTMIQNPDTTAAYYALLDRLPDDAPITVLPGVPDPQEPTQAVTAFVLTVNDLRRKTRPSVATIQVVVTASIGAKIRSTPNALADNSNKVAGVGVESIFMVEQMTIRGNDGRDWYKIAEGQFRNNFIAAETVGPKA